MLLAQRLDLLTKLQAYMLSNDPDWQAAKERAFMHNGWFIPRFTDLAIHNIATHLLDSATLAQWADTYHFNGVSPKTVGVVMPGNIPLGGFCDFCCVFLAGHKQRIRLSPKDEVLWKHLADLLISWDSAVAGYVSFEEMLKGCDAYLVTVNASASMKHYFSKYPSIIRRPGKAAAMLDGTESREQLELLADDVFQYFGQGYLNVSKIYAPRDYDFIPMLKAFERYQYLADHNKYKNNYDYQLSLLILNKEFYMTNGCILLTENKGHHAPIGRLNFEYYSQPGDVLDDQPGPLRLVRAPFGQAQRSVLCEEEGALLQFLRDL
jgi:hypothetical protein